LVEPHRPALDQFFCRPVDVAGRFLVAAGPALVGLGLLAFVRTRWSDINVSDGMAGMNGI
jgi:hypothetical protein